MPSGVYKHKKGRKRSKEVRTKMSNTHIGKHHSEITKKKISRALKGKMPKFIPSTKGMKLSDKHRKKISKARKKYFEDPEHRENMRIANLGKKHSKTTKRKMSESHKGKLGYWVGKHRSKKTRKKQSEALKGEKSSNWKGGITLLTKQIRQSFKYRQWRSDVFTRDDFTCQECGKRGCYIVAHHIKAFSVIFAEYKIKTLEEALTCEEFWNINNGLTLCEECHKPKNLRF